MLRGGSWNNNSNNCRSSKRNNNNPSNDNNDNGFRVASTPRTAPCRGIGRGAARGPGGVPGPARRGIRIEVALPRPGNPVRGGVWTGCRGGRRVGACGASFHAPRLCPEALGGETSRARWNALKRSVS
ncbi:MAG: hypothetical protein FGM37_10295 [Phycisphaerales bacterium]|nr:hypothetical protein [Phycisphaerales bacterium]